MRIQGLTSPETPFLLAFIYDTLYKMWKGDDSTNHCQKNKSKSKYLKCIYAAHLSTIA